VPFPDVKVTAVVSALDTIIPPKAFVFAAGNK